MFAPKFEYLPFSLKAPEGVRFITRSRLFTDEEAREFEAQG